jgi:hypothetical protein
MCQILRKLILAGFIFAGLLASQYIHLFQVNAWAGSPPPSKSTKMAGDCHGVDGNKDQRPKLTADTAALIAQLNPPPTDLRNPKVQYLTSDKQRAHAIREGHPGTGMFPDTTMTDQEITDTLAYLAVLRQPDSKQTSKP